MYHDTLTPGTQYRRGVPPCCHRIVCLTEEPTEILYRLGEDRRIVGISGFTVRPARARKEKPKVSAFTSAKIDRILALEPDLVFGFSDIQADIAAELIRAGVEVHIFNHRSVAEILRTVRAIAGLVGCPEKGEALVGELQAGLDRIGERAAALPRRPRVYFEEWYDPLISGIRWVSELIELAGGEDCFPEFRDLRPREGPDHRGPGRGGAPCPGRDHRIVVRAEVPAGRGWWRGRDGRRSLPWRAGRCMR